VGTDRSEFLGRDHYAALVIGTGFGGSVAACRLAQAGIDVAVIERGRRWPPGSFPRDLSRLDDGWLWLCDHGLYDATPLNDILAVRAAGYGGGSLVYANVAMRSPQEVFDERWPAPYSRAHLDPYYDLAAHMLDVSPVPGDRDLPPKTRFMGEAAERLGHTDGFFHPNLAITFTDEGPGQTNRFGTPQRGCTACGQCDIGCNVGAKNSLDLNYLAIAERAGADVGVRTEAVLIARTPDGGYRVRIREYGHPGAPAHGVERDVTARYVFVCAGAIGSTELLLRSRDQYRTLPDLPDTLGTRYSGNGDFLSFGRDLDEDFGPHDGPTITTATLVRAGGDSAEHWFVLEDGGYSEHLAKLIRTLHLSRLPSYVASSVGTGMRRLLNETRDFGGALDNDTRRTAVMLAMGRDRADGRIHLRGPKYRLRITWDTTRNDELYAQEQSLTGQVVRAFGGTPFTTPTWRLFRQPVTVHNLGGVPMGADRASGAVSPDAEVFGHPGLFVLDGAILPAPTGGNPSLTIAAVAERCVEATIRRLTGNPAWSPPERQSLTHRPAPEDAAVSAVNARGPGPPAAHGIRFTETMRGSVRLPADIGRDTPNRRAVLRLSVSIADLDTMIDDPVHTAHLGGTVEIAGLTTRPAPVTGGTLHLLAVVNGGPARTMTYALPFTDDAGNPWLLYGTKHVRRGWNTDPWRATTRLDIAVTEPDERYEGAVPTGRVTISAGGAIRLLGSIRPTSTPLAPARRGTILRFAAFFAGEVARAFLGRR
jgi:cholesterol oxidase